MIQEPPIRADRLTYLESRFYHSSDSTIYLLNLIFENLWTEMGRLASIEEPKDRYGISRSHAKRLAQAGAYTSEKLSDILARIGLLGWLHGMLGTSHDTADKWRVYASLSLKDFHADIISLMDALAYYLINIESEQREAAFEWAPGFNSLLERKKHRKHLGTDIIQAVDETAGWFMFVNKIRNGLLHRKHSRIIFGEPIQGLAFQIYLEADKPAITAEPLLFRPAGGPIVSFELYSAWVLAEVVFVMDRVAKAVADHFGMHQEQLPSGGRVAKIHPLLENVQRLRLRSECLAGTRD